MEPNRIPPTNPGQGLGIASMVLGILSLVIPYGGLVLAIVGLALGAVSKKKSTEAGMPSSMATAGIVCSIIALAWSVVCIIICSGAICSAANPIWW